MELRVMTPPELRAWYDGGLCRDFPAYERKPLNDILALYGEGAYETWGLYDGGILVGYAAFLSCPETDYVLLDYLGVAPERRNTGLGGRLLRRVCAFYAEGPGVLTEAEAPTGDGGGEDDLRRRRIGFYLRCGFRPVYEMGGCGVRLQGLLLGEPPAEPEALMATHRAIYGPKRTDIAVPLAAGEAPPAALFV